MKSFALLIGLALVCLLVSNVDGKRVRRDHSDEQGDTVPEGVCAGGVFDPMQCSCGCNGIGPVAPELFCFINSIVCATIGMPMAAGCCEENTIFNFIPAMSMYSGGGGGPPGR